MPTDPLLEETYGVLSEHDAHELARDAHDPQLDRDGQFHIRHVERVVAMVPADCKRVAWLHDVCEDSDTSFGDLKRVGLPDDELVAVALLTRKIGAYKDYILAIAGVPGVAGDMARTVKEADLLDNLRRCLEANDASAAKRYRESLHTIQGAILREQ